MLPVRADQRTRLLRLDPNIRMISDFFPHMSTSTTELRASGPFSVYFIIGADWNVWRWSGASQNVIFPSNSYIPDSVKSYLKQCICYCEGPGEQPGMSILLPFTHDQALYHILLKHLNSHCIIKPYTCSLCLCTNTVSAERE